MSKLTDFLKLFKWDLEDPNDLENDFNIQKSLNDNWDKIDAKTKELSDDKVDKKEGYDLSQENFTTILKNKLLELKNYDDSALRQIIDGSIKDITLDPTNGYINFIKNDGTTVFIDTALELIIKSGKYDKKTKKIILTLANEDKIEIPIGDLITDIYSKQEIDEILNGYEKKHNYFTMLIEEEIETEQDIEIPCSYIVGNDEIVIFIDGIFMKCEKSANDEANYREVGQPGTVSNKIQFGFNLLVGEEIRIVKKGAVEDEQT